MIYGLSGSKRELVKLENWANSTPVYVNKGKQKVPLERSNLIHDYKMGVDQLEQSSAENDLEILANSTLYLSQK